MGLKDYLSRKAQEAKDKADTKLIETSLMSGGILSTLDTAIDSKIKSFSKHGIPITLNRLMEGSEVLIRIVRIPEQTIRDHIVERCKEMGVQLVEG